MLFIFKLKIGKSYIMKKGEEDFYVHNDIEHLQKTKKRGEYCYVHNDIEHLKKPKSKYMIFKQVYTNQKGC